MIAIGRLTLAMVSMIAVYLDPTEPASHAQGTYTILAGYLIFAVLITVLVDRRAAQRGQRGGCLCDHGRARSSGCNDRFADRTSGWLRIPAPGLYEWCEQQSRRLQ
jgi:hypothetical protein